MLSFILCVTLTAPDLAATESAYVTTLGYAVVDRGTVSVDQASLWGASSSAGRRYALLKPASGANVFLRIVEQPATPGYRPLATHGWNANEILVSDPDAVHARVRGSAFRVIGEPRPLEFNPKVVAMQAVGPADEVIYLTRIPPGGSKFDLGSAQSLIDRTFIVVVGGQDIDALVRFYGQTLGLPTTAPAPTTIDIVARELGLPADTPVPLAIARLPKDFLIELDGYPTAATPRPVRAGELPPGMAMVTFGVDSLDSVKAAWIAPPRVIGNAPYAGRRVGVLRGPAGELVELVETGVR